ncbi:MFS transporter [Parvibaculum sp.]|jgi:MFS family permease|uniref:spinster family MFS transporter n=1 Tax=Parvibaculum sp. TaxID=2024848 RepID=UPI001B12CCF9|nr:MFS transporter [Parvibaculum sp.]MBO6636052.1 MFS transporter [Parvibaculum sp.]MBO6680025.1 MFS transporter [Parvibaculum sp.]MBO6683647.1 MFS transporter [Parvibaculum sp.]
MSEVEVASEVEEELHHPHKAAGAEKPYPNQVYAWYVVGILVLAYTFSFIDRQILSLLVGPMKRDLGISDTQMSLLQGFAFAVFYCLAGLPIGRMVDSRNRVNIISIGVFVWSVMTALCGTAHAYWQLFLYRMGVGVGEAALSPAAYSMIADYFPPKRLGFALGVYGMGVYIGAGLALIIGAAVIGLVSGGGDIVVPIFGEVYAWQLTFFIVGLPGILIALWVWTVKEPERRGYMRKEIAEDGTETAVEVPVSEVFAYMRVNWRTIAPLNVCYALSAMMAYGVAAWIPTFFVRTYDWTYPQAGWWYGWIIVVFGTTGVVAGGWMGDVLTNRGIRNGRMMVCAFTGLAALPFTVLYPLMDSPWMALLLICFSTFFATFTTGAGPSALQELMPNQMRGLASAALIFVVSIVGLGLGPTSIALATDYIFGDEMMLRYSLVYVPAVILVLAVTAGFLGLKPYIGSLDYLKRWSAEHEK